MNERIMKVSVVVFLLATAAALAIPALAQTEVKEKPPMYSYVGNWAIPRAQWGDMEKSEADNDKVLKPALANGTLVGYGNDMTIVHSADGETHDEWWSSTSMAGLLNVLNEFYKNGSSVSPVLASATKHWDEIYMSRYYNWHSGSWTGAYTHTSSYKLKADAPDDALDTLSKNLFVPLLEKLLSGGVIHEYEIDTQAIHTSAPGSFYIFYIAANAEGIDKVNAALRDAMKANPLGGPAFESVTDFTGHRDGLLRTNATFK